MRLLVLVLGALSAPALAVDAPPVDRESAGRQLVEFGLRLDGELRLRPSTADLSNPLAPNADLGPTYLQADDIQGSLDTAIDLRGRAEIRQLGQSLRAERIQLDLVTSDLSAEGDVVLYRGGERYSGPSLKINLDTRRGEFESVDYEFPLMDGRGSASRVRFLGPSQTELVESDFTTCRPGEESWSLRSDRMVFDQISETAEAENARLAWEGLGSLPLPDISFATTNRRRSGLLAPTYSFTSRLGLDITTPYYVNISPDRDLTVFPRLITQRGLQMGSEYRYLTPRQSGILEVDYLASDRVFGEARSRGRLRHQHQLASNLALQIDVLRVSDDDYFTDFGGSLLEASQRTLPASALLTSSLAGWGLSLQVQEFQQLQDPAAPVVAPYSTLPRLAFGRSSQVRVGDDSLLNSLAPIADVLDWSASGEFAQFAHPTLLEAQRAVLRSSVAAPKQFGALTLTPRLSLHGTTVETTSAGSADGTFQKYRVQAANLGVFSNNAGVGESYSRFVPTLSLDSQLEFERELSVGGQGLRQTLTPRIFYAYAPFRDQSLYPVFDSAEANISLGQLFAEQPFVGDDRVADQNQITAGVQTRFLDDGTGQELLRAGLAQRYFLDDQRVVLPGQQARTGRESDLLAELGLQLGPSVSIDSFAQYTQQTSRWQAGLLTAQYTPRPGQTFSAAYRYARDAVNSVDLAMQTPISGRWYAVGRTAFSLQDRKVVDGSQQPGLIEALAGVEYNGGCWVVRVVGQRFVSSTNERNTAVFLQIELAGIARVGPDPLSALRQGIPGYRPVNQLRPPPAIGDAYQ